MTRSSTRKECRKPSEAPGVGCFLQAKLAEYGTVYVILASIICKSTDGGRTWTSYPRSERMNGLFEVLSDGTFIGITGSYNASVVLKDDIILTIAGSSQAGNSWEAVIDNTDMTAIRWKPVKQ